MVTSELSPSGMDGVSSLMRSPCKFIAFALCLGLVATVAKAQNGVGSPDSSHSGHVMARTTSLAPALSLILRGIQPLTHAEMVKIQSIWNSGRNEGKAVLADTRLTVEERRTKAKAVQDITLSRIRAALTAEQLLKFDAVVAALSAPPAAPAPALQAPDPQFQTESK
jgi:hypothetical protein